MDSSLENNYNATYVENIYVNYKVNSHIYFVSEIEFDRSDVQWLLEKTKNQSYFNYQLLQLICSLVYAVFKFSSN